MIFDFCFCSRNFYMFAASWVDRNRLEFALCDFSLWWWRQRLVNVKSLFSVLAYLLRTDLFYLSEVFPSCLLWCCPSHSTCAHCTLVGISAVHAVWFKELIVKMFETFVWAVCDHEVTGLVVLTATAFHLIFADRRHASCSIHHNPQGN